MNMSPEMQYEFLKNCYYNCNGKDNNCEYYRSQEVILPKVPCVNYLALIEDEIKLKYKTGKPLKYPLDRIIEEFGYR